MAAAAAEEEEEEEAKRTEVEIARQAAEAAWMPSDEPVKAGWEHEPKKGERDEMARLPPSLPAERMTDDGIVVAIARARGSSPS